MKAPAVPARRPIRNFVRRCFEIPLGIVMLVVLYPIYGARELWREFVKLIDSWIGLRGRAEARSLEARPGFRMPVLQAPPPGIPVPPDTPAQRAAYEAECGKLDTATGGGLAAGRNTAIFRVPAHHTDSACIRGAGAIEAGLNKLGEDFDALFGQGMQGMQGMGTGWLDQIRCNHPGCKTPRYFDMNGDPSVHGLCREHYLAHQELVCGPKVCCRDDCSEACLVVYQGEDGRLCERHWVERDERLRNEGPAAREDGATAGGHATERQALELRAAGKLCKTEGCWLERATLGGDPIPGNLCSKHYLAHQEDEKKKIAAVGSQDTLRRRARA